MTLTLAENPIDVVGSRRQDEGVPETMPLVGRDRELGDVIDLLTSAASSTAGGLLLSGDAGVGKTRLLGEAMARAEALGMARLLGHCMDFGDIGLPFLPFSEAFGRLARENPELVEAIEQDFAPITRLLPQRRMLGSAPSSDDARLERADLFAAVLGALGAVGRHSPTLLVIEDAHWADQSTRDLIGFLLTRLDHERVGLVVSYRSDDLHRRHPLRPAVAEWSRLPGVRRLDLAPLPDDDVRQLITNLAPSPLPSRELSRLVERAEGNAFFAEELVAASSGLPQQSSRLVPSRDATGGVPAALAELLLVRLDRLSDAARAVVRLVAVAGRRVPHDMLERVAWLRDTELDDALREAIDENILRQVGDNQYAFRHALLGEAVYDDLLPGERVRLHGEFASALAKETVPGTAAELARHARASQDLDTAFHASIRAGDEAFAVAAPQEAMGHYEAALAMLPRLGGVTSAAFVDLVVEAAGAASAAGHLLRARDLALAGVAEVPPDASAFDRARALASAADHLSVVEAELQALEATTEAMHLIAELEPSAFGARLTALHARTLAQLGRNDEAERWASEAVDLAHRVDDHRAAADARTTLAVLVRRRGEPDEARRQLRILAEGARVNGQIGQELRALFQLGVLSFGAADLEQAAVAYRACWDRARETGRAWSTYGLDARCHLILLEHYRGDWQTAAAAADLSGEHPTNFAALKVSAAGMAVLAGRGDQTGADLLPGIRTKFRQDALMAIWSLPQAAELASQRGDTDTALCLLDEMVEVVTAVWQQPWFLARLRTSALGIGILSAGWPAMSAPQRERAIERAGAFHREGHTCADLAQLNLGPEAFAWLARLDAEHARFRWLSDTEPPPVEEHIALWHAALDGFADQPFERAVTQARLAALLKAAGRPAEAGSLAQEAASIAGRLGAAPLLAEISSLRLAAAGGAADSRPMSGPDSLTARERDVLALLVEGRTNRQIARLLFISEKTVSVHVSNILAKLGVASRTEAAATARRHNLTVPA